MDASKILEMLFEERQRGRPGHPHSAGYGGQCGLAAGVDDVGGAAGFASSQAHRPAARGLEGARGDAGAHEHDAGAEGRATGQDLGL